MGCNQSSERKGASAPAAEPQPQPAKAEVTEPVAEPAQVAEPVATEQPSAPQEATEEVPLADPATVETIAAPVEELHQQPEEPTAAAAVPEPTVVAGTAEPASAPQETEAEPTPQEAVVLAPKADEAKATPVVPALALPRKRASALAKRSGVPSRASSKNSRASATPRAQKENAANAKQKTPAKAQSVRRGLSMSASTNQGTAEAAQKKVCFDAVPAQEDAVTKRKNKAKKTAGKHGCNVNEELFLASIAAFERQLTHRASLDSQLNSR